MSNNFIWLLVEVVDNPEPVFEIVGIEGSLCRGHVIRTRKLIKIRTPLSQETRLVLIRAISPKKEDLKVQKKQLEKEESQYDTIVTESSNDIKRRRLMRHCFQPIRRPAIQPHGNRPAPRIQESSSDDSSSTDEEMKRFNDIIKSLKNYSAHIKQNAAHRQSLPPMVTSTPDPTKCGQQYKLTFDQGTQTDESGPSSPDVHILSERTIVHISFLETMLRGVYRHFLKLTNLEDDERMAIDMDVSQDRSDNELRDIAGTEADHSALSSSGSEGRRPSMPRPQANPQPQPGPSRMRHCALHRNPGQQIKNLPASERNVLVGIGTGQSDVPWGVLNDIDFNSFSEATRRLLFGVRPSRRFSVPIGRQQPPPKIPHKPKKKILNPKLVDDIVLTVTQRCGVTPEMVRKAIKAICEEENRIYRNRLIRWNGRIMDPTMGIVPPSPPSTTESSD